MTLDLRSLFHATIGYDDLGKILNEFANSEQSNNYPPYNILKLQNNKYRISIALAGFSIKDITITIVDIRLIMSVMMMSMVVVVMIIFDD